MHFHYNTYERFCQEILEKNIYITKVQQQMHIKQKFISDLLNAAEKAGRSDTMIANLKACSTQGIITKNENRLIISNQCHHKLCPMCSWFRTRIEYKIARSIMSGIKDKFHFLHLTLTVRNVKFTELSKQMNKLNEAYKRMFQRKRFKEICKGQIRNMEITYNSEKDTFHPHFHIIIAVPKRYFKSDLYMSHEEFLSEWKSATRAEYTPGSHIQRIKATDETDVAGAVLEVCKYPFKLSDVYQIKDSEERQKVLSELMLSMYNRRMHTYSGVFREYRAVIKNSIKESVDMMAETAPNNVVPIAYDEALGSYKIRKELLGKG